MDFFLPLLSQVSCTIRSSRRKRSIPVIVRVSDINDNAPVFQNTPYETTVPEVFKSHLLLLFVHLFCFSFQTFFLFCIFAYFGIDFNFSKKTILFVNFFCKLFKYSMFSICYSLRKNYYIYDGVC